MRRYTIAETFVGAGGSHCGFKAERFKTVFVNDISKIFIETLLHNNPEIRETSYISTISIENVDARGTLKSMKLRKGQLDVLFGGTVCKGYSLAGMRNPNDDRNQLYLEQLRLVKEWRPKISIIENVPAIESAVVYRGQNKKLLNQISSICQELSNYKGRLSALRKGDKKLSKKEQLNYESLKKKRKEVEEEIRMKSRPVLEDIKTIYNRMGYTFSYKKLNAAWYGAATKRNRVIMVAVRQDIKKPFSFPKIAHINSEINFLTDVTKCTKLKPPVSINERLKKLKTKNRPKVDIDNRPMNHSEKTIKRFSFIPEGGNIIDVLDKVPNDLKVSGFYSRGCTMRLDGKKPAPTLVPGHSNFPVHPKENRSITVREAATITGFPVNYKFFGSHTQRCEQVGNAVPIELSRAIAKEVKKVLRHYYSSK